MKLSEYIQKLQKMLETNGDRDIYTRVAFDDDTDAYTSPVKDDEVIHIMDVGDLYCEEPIMQNKYILK